MKKFRSDSKVFQRRLAVFLQSLGCHLFLLRMERGESLQTVAKAIKRSPRFLSKVEKGLAPKVKVGVIIDLCKYYKAQFSDILK